MKKLILLVLVGLSSINHLSAQTYKINKLNYDYKLYSPGFNDPYNPTACGIASFFIPGLGQMIAGETERGLLFFGGAVCCGAVYMGSVMYSYLDNQYNEFNGGIPTLMLLGLAGSTTIHICSIVDATKVAKVNNMYFQDVRKRKGQSSIEDIQLTPFIDRLAINNQIVTPVGLKLSVTF